MANQAFNATAVTWILLVAWVVFNLVIFLKLWAWVLSGLGQVGDQPYIRLQSGLNRLMVVAVVDVIWMGAILWASGVNNESLLCLPVIFLVVLGPAYIVLRRFYRRMQKGKDQSTN